MIRKKSIVKGEFVVIVLYLLWPLFIEIPFSSNIYYIVVFSLFTWAILALLANYRSASYGNTFWGMLISLAIWSVMMFGVYNFTYRQKTISFIIFNIDTHARLILLSFILIITGMMLFEYAVLKETRVFRGVIFLIVTTCLFFSLRAVAVFPDALRARASAVAYGHEEYLFGTPSYSVVYSMALLAPHFLNLFSVSQGIKRWFYLYIVVALSLIIAVSQFATALIILMAEFIYYLVERKAKYRNFGQIMVIIIAISLMVFLPFIGDALILISAYISGAWSEKLVEIGVFLLGQGAMGDLGARTDLYRTSLQAFKESPIVGMLFGRTGVIGGHSTLLDMLALIGLFGTAFYFILLFNLNKRLMQKMTDRTLKITLQTITLGFVILIVTKDIASALAIQYTYFVVVPMLLLMKRENSRLN